MTRGAWHSRIEYACWKCGYDVTRTLLDRIGRCPECGESISEESCSVTLRRLPSTARVILCVVWMSPILIVPGAVTMVDHWRFRGSPGTFPAQHMALVYLAALVVVIVACEAGCYLLWWRVEKWRRFRGAAVRAIGRTAVVIAMQIGAVAAILGALFLLSP